LLEETLRDQGTELTAGDILLVRTAWLRMLAEQRDRAAFFAARSRSQLALLHLAARSSSRGRG
jgi:hypothetical protein